MSKLYITLILICNALFASAQNCSMLKNGNYKIEFDESNNSNSGSIFKLLDDDAKFTTDNIVEEFEMIQLEECQFTLKSKEKINESKLTDFQLMLMRQSPYYDITNVIDDVYYFTMRINLHVQCGSGKFIKLPDN